MRPHQALDRVFQALSDPSRLAIVDRLSQGDASVSELAKPLAMTLAAVVQHVQLLEASGLIRTEKLGRVRNCHLDREVLSQVELWLVQRREYRDDDDGDDRSHGVPGQQKTEQARVTSAPSRITPATVRRPRKPT